MAYLRKIPLRESVAWTSLRIHRLQAGHLPMKTADSRAPNCGPYSSKIIKVWGSWPSADRPLAVQAACDALLTTNFVLRVMGVVREACVEG